MTHGKTAARLKPQRVLAIASNGGHWVQLRRLRPAWEGAQVTYVSTSRGCRAEVVESDVGIEYQTRFLAIVDANREKKLRLLLQLLQVAVVVGRAWPDVVVSTGAAPGYWALRFGKLIGARTVWVDSIANADELSLSGRLAGPYADLWLTQWEALARTTTDEQGRPEFSGAVL